MEQINRHRRITIFIGILLLIVGSLTTVLYTFFIPVKSYSQQWTYFSECPIVIADHPDTLRNPKNDKYHVMMGQLPKFNVDAEDSKLHPPETHCGPIPTDRVRLYL